MIVRVLSDRQYDVPDAALGSINALDLALDAALRENDAAAFAATLEQLVAQVRSLGSPLSVEELVPSDRTVPAPGSTLEEVRTLLDSEPEGGLHS